jgi:hypothetical protein
MTQLPRRFIEDRALRDAARAVLVNDIDRLRASLDEQGIASRVSSGVTTTISSRIRSGARDVLDQAKAQAGDHKGVLAVLIGGIILWLSRGPILDWMDELAEDFDLAEEDIDPTVAPAGAPADDAQGEPE